jgi:hypothetical protein
MSGCPVNHARAAVEVPRNMRGLPVDERGYVIPWFVKYVGGKPDFRIADTGKWEKAVQFKLCWVCGNPFTNRRYAFAIGPMCTVNKVSSEPPSHEECAIYAAKVCPFLANANRERREDELTDGCVASGEMIKRNPGVTAIYITRDYKTFKAKHTDNTPLFELGAPLAVHWYRNAEIAANVDILRSMATGYPLLRSMADNDDAKFIKYAPFDKENHGNAVRALNKGYREAVAIVRRGVII